MLRFFGRKVPKMTNSINKPNPLTDEFQKYIDEQIAKGFCEEALSEEILGNNTLNELANALKTGREIDFEKIDIKFPEELEKRLDSVVNADNVEKTIGEIEKGLPSDIMSRLSKIKNLSIGFLIDSL
jgi:hypothetical protein